MAAVEFWPEDRDDQLIEVWRENPCLFDITCREYVNRSKKANVYADIAVEVISTELPPVFNCTFETGICGWEQDGTDNFDWNRHKGGTLSSDRTGPANDHTHGTSAGYYMYIEATSRSRYSKARLITPEVPQGPKCLQFFYHMRGKDIGSLNVYVYTNETGRNQVPAWTMRGNFGFGWRHALVTLNESEAFKVVFEGVRGTDYAGDIAIDDVTITNATQCRPVLETFNCTFDKSECGWTQSSEDDFNWTLNHGGTDSSGTGPSADHTTRDGLYMYIEATPVRNDAKAQLISPDVVPAGQGACLQFFYHMYGNHIGALNIYTRSAQNVTSSLLWTRQKNAGNQWRRGYVTLNQTTPFKVVFEGVRGSDHAGDIAIDDVTITNATLQCRPVLETFNCTFDISECGWTQSSEDDFNWTLNYGGTGESSVTGPSADHTTRNGRYMYIEATAVRNDAKAQLISPDVVPAGQGACFQFFYHMHGNHIGALNIYTRSAQNVTSSLLWTRQKKAGNQWRRGHVTLNQTTPYKVIIEGVRGNGDEGDIAVDDLTISNFTCATYKTFNCTFDEDECGWQQTDVNDDFDWTSHQGATPSLFTGPSRDRTPGIGGHYMYIEASNGQRGDTAHLLSPNVTVTGTMCLQFYYHMWGSDIGTLNVYTHSLPRPGSRHNIWSLSGKQENNWKQGNAEVNAPIGSTFQVTFEGIRGADYAGDISIDDISLSDKPCPAAGVLVGQGEIQERDAHGMEPDIHDNQKSTGL